MAKINSKKMGKLIFGYSLVGVSLVLFVLSCIPNFAVSNFFKGVFGFAWYAYLILAFLLGIANVSELKFMWTKKFTFRLSMCFFALIAFLHLIFSHNQVILFQGFSQFKDYLAYCFSAETPTTIGGAFFGIFVYFSKTIFTIVGAYSVFIMIFTIFGGIVIDDIIYKNAKIKKEQVLPIYENLPEKQNFSSQEPTTSYMSINNGQVAPQKEEYIEQDYMSQPDVQSVAHDTLFPNRNMETYRQAPPQNAREILFGQREIPDITLPNDEYRDKWMQNTAREFGQTEEDSQNINDIFGSNSLDTDLYNRGFGNSAIIDDDEPDMNNGLNSLNRSRFADRSFAPQNRTERDLSQFSDLPTREDKRDLSRFSDRQFSPRNVASASQKLGEDDDDIAKPFDMNFDSDFAPIQKQTKPKVQGKQIGIKSVRYNSIPLSIFKTYEEKNADYSEEYRRKSAAIENVMHHFGVGAKVINVVRGPKVTRYELSLPDGVPVSKVLALDKNISMALAARSEIRIEAPIPGKNAFGIELENDVSSTVGMRELLESPEFINCKDPLPIAIGKNINGQVIIKSLPKMIHLLVAGSSGSGKSIFIHTLLMSILYKYSPNDVRFIMIDPKRVEFTMYAQLPHLMLPDVVDEHDKALKVLNWTVAEMEERYKLLKSTQSQNIEQYNKLPDVTSGKVKKMCYLIIVVDELAELMGGAMKKDFEAAIQRITQLGRAAGIHMVLATQRPSVDVVSGTIKNNLPSRVAFALASAVDSKTVLDVGGAEKLLGKGDMLFAPQDMNVKIRLQAAFCDNDEIRNAINYIKENNETDFDEDLVNEIYAEKSEEDTEGTDALGNGGGSVESVDDLMKPVVKYARSLGKISSSMLQRKFRIGFNRAARIVFELEEMGFVGPQIGAKPRDFVMSDEQYIELFGEDDDDSIF